MHHLFDNSLGKALPDRGKEISLCPKGSAKSRIAAQFFHHGVEFVYHLVAHYSAKCRDFEPPFQRTSARANSSSNCPSCLAAAASPPNLSALYAFVNCPTFAAAGDAGNVAACHECGGNHSRAPMPRRLPRRSCRVRHRASPAAMRQRQVFLYSLKIVPARIRGSLSASFSAWSLGAIHWKVFSIAGIVMNPNKSPPAGDLGSPCSAYHSMASSGYPKR